MELGHVGWGHLAGSVQGKVTDSCEHCNESSSNITDGEFFRVSGWMLTSQRLCSLRPRACSNARIYTFPLESAHTITWCTKFPAVFLVTSSIFWDIMLWSLLKVSCFVHAYCLHLQNQRIC
jgi:hypothetical protein